jgi:hypothetical protein
MLAVLARIVSQEVAEVAERESQSFSLLPLLPPVNLNWLQPHTALCSLWLIFWAVDRVTPSGWRLKADHFSKKVK